MAASDFNPITKDEADRIDGLIQHAGTILSSLHELAEEHELATEKVPAFTIAVKAMAKEAFRTLDNALMLLARIHYPPMGCFTDEPDYQGSPDVVAEALEGALS